MLKWTDKAKQHAYKLRATGVPIATIAALLGRTKSSVKNALATMREDNPRAFYNRNEVATLLGLTVDEFLRHQESLEEKAGMPESARPRYAVPKQMFNRWLHRHYYPQLTVKQWVDQTRAKFLKTTFDQRPDDEINRAAKLMRAAESLLNDRG